MTTWRRMFMRSALLRKKFQTLLAPINWSPGRRTLIPGSKNSHLIISRNQKHLPGVWLPQTRKFDRTQPSRPELITWLFLMRFAGYIDLKASYNTTTSNFVELNKCKQSPSRSFPQKLGRENEVSPRAFFKNDPIQCHFYLSNDPSRFNLSI